MGLRLLALIVHLIGFALGLGGATISDIIFFKSFSRGKFSTNELSTLTTLSRVIWIGLGFLIISGLSIFALIYTEQSSLSILSSSRLQAKLTLVGIVLINGLVFKYSIFPFLHRNADQAVSTQTFGPKLWRLAISGAISIVSWYSILVISNLPGEFRPPYLLFIVVWLGLVILGAITGKFILQRSIK